MSEVEREPSVLDLPRDEDGLATSAAAQQRLEGLLPTFLRDRVAAADADGLLVTLDGSVESVLTASMAVEAVGAERVTGVITPAQLTDEAPARDAEAVASLLGVDAQRLQLHSLLTEFQNSIGATGEPIDDLVALENAVTRFRTACLYYLANTTNRLVVGSLTRTELLLGTMAKHGETAVDLSLLGDLYRTEVAAFTDYLDVPSDLVTDRQYRSRRSARTDAAELDVALSTLDSILHYAVDLDRDRVTTAERVDVAPELVERVQTWCEQCAHKRRLPPSPSSVG